MENKPNTVKVSGIEYPVNSIKKIRFYSQGLFYISKDAWSSPKEYIKSLGYNILSLTYDGFMDCFLGYVDKLPDIKPDFIEYIEL